MSDHHLAENSSSTSALTVKRLDPAIATLMAGRGSDAALMTALSAKYQLNLPGGPQVSSGNGLSFVGMGPGRWLVLAENQTGEAFEAALANAAAPAGSVCDQSDGYVIFELSGDEVLETLAKMVLIDIEMVGPGHAATTSASLIGITLWRPSEAKVFFVAVARSYTEAFLHALSQSSSGFTLA